MPIIILNPRANSGNALPKWRKIAAGLRDHLGDYDLVQPATPQACSVMIVQALRDGQQFFIAAGGDGTVNLVLNALFNATHESERRTLTFGAIGLGSSNDFHKPFSPDRTLAQVPIRLNPGKVSRYDVGKVTYHDETGRSRHRYFLINASLGVAACANHLFNSGEALIEWLQKRSVNAAIVWAALKTIIRYRNIPVAIALNGSRPLTTTVTNLGIIKNPHFAGDFCYDTPIAPDSGDFGVNLCEGMTRSESLKILYHLSHHTFLGRPKTRAWRTSHLHLHTAFPVPLETDGEIVMTDEADFEILPQALRVCQ
jgi:diacylglycerol kinase family enzyme